MSKPHAAPRSVRSTLCINIPILKMQMWRKWEEEKGQNGDVDLFVDCKEGDSIEWIVPLAVTYIGWEDAERSGFLFWHCSWIEEYNTIGSAWNITYIERENTKKQNTEISPILSGRIQSASCFSMLPDVPNLWNVHFVILPSTIFIFVSFLYICHPSQHKIII